MQFGHLLDEARENSRSERDTLRRVKPAVAEGPRHVDSHLKVYESGQQMSQDLESKMMDKGAGDLSRCMREPN